MPSFDVVSEVNMHEVTNAVDQSNREVTNRFDFKGTNSRFEQSDSGILMVSVSDFNLKQMLEILKLKLTKRGIDITCLVANDPETSGKEARQNITLRQGIDAELAKKMIKMIKDSKMKVQGSVQGDKVRVSGKKRDDLQKVIAMIKEADLGIPIQFVNMRD